MSSESESDYSPVKKRKVTRSKALLSSSSSSSDDDSDVPIRKRKSRRIMFSSSSDSDDSIIVNKTHKRPRVLSDYDSDSTSSISYESETEGEMRRIIREAHRPGPRPVQAESNGCVASKKSDKSDTSDDESERCIICFKTFRGIIAHPSGCHQHFFHSNCLQTWSKTSNTCPIDRVKYNSIILLGSNNEVVERIGVTTPPPQDHNNDLEPDDPTFCEVCHQHDREDEMLLCDRCDTGYHLNCLDPPLAEVPIGNWFCPRCAVHAADDDIDEDEVNDLLREGVILESRMRHRAAVPSRRVGPRTRAVQRVLATIRQMAEEAERYQPSTSTSRSGTRRVRRRKKSHRRRSTRYKVELVTVEDGSTIEVKVAVNTRTKRRKKKSNASCGRRRKGGSKRSSASAGGMEGYRGRDSGIPSLDIMGSRPTLEYFSGCEAEDELEGDGGLSILRARSSIGGVRGMANRKQIAAQLLRTAPRRPTPRIAVSSAPPDLLSSILDEQTKWHSPNAVIQSNRDGELRVILPDKDKGKAPVRKAAGNGEAASGSMGNSASVKDSGGGERSGQSSSTSTVPPLQPPPQPPNFSRVYEDEDFDLYADIEPPRLAPPPEPPALLLALEGDEAASSPEDAALVIDDERQAYDPDVPTSPPPSPPPLANAEKTKKGVDPIKKPVEATTDQIAIDLSSIRLPSPEPDIDDCPNRVFYSEASINIAKEKGDSDGEMDLPNHSQIISKINLDSNSEVNKVLNNKEAIKDDVKNVDVKDVSPAKGSGDVKPCNKEPEEKAAGSSAIANSDKYDPDLSDEDEDQEKKDLSDNNVIQTEEELIKEDNVNKNDDVKENAEQSETDSHKLNEDLKENIEPKEIENLKGNDMGSDHVIENDDIKGKVEPKDEPLEITKEDNDKKPEEIDDKDVEMLEGKEFNQKVDTIKEEEKMDEAQIEEKAKEDPPEEKIKLEEGELNSDEGELKEEDEELKDEEGELKDDEESKDDVGYLQKNKDKTLVKDKAEDNAELDPPIKGSAEREDSRPGSPNNQECNKNEKDDDDSDNNDKSPQRTENRSQREKRKDDSTPESTPPKKDAEEGEDVLELGCGDDERDGLVDITDEEISTYEKSWELEDNQAPNEKTAGLEGLETEAISEGEDNMAEDGHARAAAENGPKEEGEIISDEKRVPVAWKKVTKAKERSYREKESLKEKNKKKEKKPKEKRKELERYDVRKIISDKPKKRKVDEFGRDISPSRSRSLSDSRSRSRSLSVRSRSRRSRSRSRSRSRKRRSRERRARSRSRGRSRGRSRIRSRDRSRDRSKRRGRSKSKSRSGSRRRKSRSPRKKERRSRAKSREKKRRKRDSSMSCSSCSCSSCERERRKSKKLTVIVPNEPAVRKDKKKSKYKDRGDLKRRRVDSPVPSKEVFTSGDNILVSVNFKSSKSGEVSRKEPSKKKRDEEPKKKKDKSSKENQPLRSIVSKSSNQSSRRSRLNARNLKPVAIIDLAQSPFREQTLSPKEIIVLTDSDSDDKRKPDENNIPVCQITGPKTPPEPHIKFNIVSSKPQILRSLANPLLDSVDQLEGEGEEEEDERVDMPHKGPNTPPEPPVPYDPFEPTKSRSPTPLQELEENRNSPVPPGDKSLPPEPPQRPVSPPKPPPEPPKTPSPLHSPPPKPPEDIPTEKIHISPPNNCDDDSMDMGGGDSPYSPGSSGGGGDDDIFEPPLPQITTPAPMSKAKRPGMKLPKLTPSPLKRKPGANKNTTPLKNNKGGKKESISMKLDEDQLKILDDLPNSAVEMQVKDKFLKKLNRQERVVEEVKMVLKPHYAKKHVNKEEYKEILRKSVPKICHSRSGEINPIKIQRLIEAYVKKYRHLRKKRKMATTNFSAPESIPLLKPKPKPTMWC